MIVGNNLVPTHIAQKAIVQNRFALVLKFIAHDVGAATRQAEGAFTRARKRVARAQRLGDGGAGEAGRNHAAQSAFSAKHRRARNAAATTTAMLVARHAGTEFVATLDGLLIQPAEVTPRRTDFDQAFQLRMVPVQNAAPPADVRD